MTPEMERDAEEIGRLVRVLQGSDWEAAVGSVTEQLEAKSADEAQAMLLLALIMLIDRRSGR